MTSNEYISKKLKEFVEAAAGMEILSTGARVVYEPDDLCNVSGSSDDPSEVPGYENYSWKKLLIEKAGLAGASCYVTNVPAPAGSSHPDFSVGGHMTKSADGSVPYGGISYLMPLCKWHNSTARNGMAFEHTETKMLELTGYMQGEIALSFLSRQQSDQDFSLIAYDPDQDSWGFTNINAQEALRIQDVPSLPTNPFTNISQHLLIERHQNGDRALQIKEVLLD